MLDLQHIQRKGFERALQHMPAAVIIVEAPSGRIIFRNREALRIRERSLSQATELDGARGFRAPRPDGLPHEVEEWPLMRSIRTGEELRGEEFVYPLADGTELYLRCDCSPIYDEEGRIVAGVMVSHDVTVSKRPEEELRQTENAPGQGTKITSEAVLNGDPTMEPTEGGAEGVVRVLLVEDHAVIREAMASSLAAEPDMEVAGQAGSLSEARAFLEEDRGSVDVVLVDLGLPDGRGTELIRELRASHPEAQSLVLSAILNRAETARAVEGGARGSSPRRRAWGRWSRR